MEESIFSFCKGLGSFCNHLQSSCDALKQSVDRRPIPLDSASSTFIQCLNRRVSSASSDLNLLESMSFGTVSFEELLGHCNEVYKKNQRDLFLIEERLKSLGYVPEVDIDVEDDENSGVSTHCDLDARLTNSKCGFDAPSCYTGKVTGELNIIKSLEEDPLLDDSLSLRNLGLSDVCLATLASADGVKIDDPDLLQEPMKCFGDKPHDIKGQYQSETKTLGVNEGPVVDDLSSFEAPRPILEVSKVDYEAVPSYMKNLASWEDLLNAVEKINSSLSKKDRMKESNYFLQDEIESLGLGPKARTYLLLLVRMNRLVVETIDGLISYRVL